MDRRDIVSMLAGAAIAMCGLCVSTALTVYTANWAAMSVSWVISAFATLAAFAIILDKRR